MAEHRFTEKDIHRFAIHLREQEYAQGSVEKYLRDIRAFAAWMGEGAILRETPARWKEHLLKEGCKPETVNSKLSAINRFFTFLGWKSFRIKYLRIQRKLFRKTEKELTKEDYTRLLHTAKEAGKERLALLMETICATGIRVSEVKYITAEALCHGRAEVFLKGKIRTIFIPGKLCKKLRKYAKKQRISAGEIFCTRSGKGMSRRQIWAEMKALCKRAGVAPTKVFPHNLRHLFARTFYQVHKDAARLADVLGHSSMETTRIYLISTGAEHARQIERLGLLS